MQAERSKLDSKIQEALIESQSLKNSSSTHNKVRKSDVEEAKKLATKARQEADTANSDPRMTVIPQEIREAENKIADLKGQIEDDQRLVTELRKHEDEHREIQMLKRQVENDREVIVDGLKDENSTLYKYQIDQTLGEDNDDPDYIFRTMDDKANAVNSAFLLNKDKLDAAERKLNDAQKRLTEKRSLHSHNARQLVQLRNQHQALSQPNRGPATIETVIKESQRWDVAHNKTHSVGNNFTPQQIIDHFSQRIADCNEDGDSPESIRRLMKKLKSLAMINKADGTQDLMCPCCERTLNADEAKTFKEAMKKLADRDTSPIIEMDQKNAKERKDEVEVLTKWKSEVQASIGDYLELKRVNNEIAALEDPVATAEAELKTLEDQVKELKDDVDSEQATVTELRQLNEVMNRLRDEASKISRKLTQIRDKEISIGTSQTGGSQDLTAVERSLSSKTKAKEDLMNDISGLNKESSELNKRAKDASDRATTLEQSAKAKEAQYEQDQQASVRKTELSELINGWRDEDKKIEKEEEPIRRQLHMKETDLKRLRQSNKTEEDRLSKVLNEFERDTESLDDFNEKIRKYEEVRVAVVLHSIRWRTFFVYMGPQTHS